MAINSSSEFSEVDKVSYISAVVSVGTTQVEAKVGGSRLDGRQSIILFNKSTETIYWGPSGVTTSTGVALYPQQFLQMSLGDLGLFLIAGTTGPHSVVVQELG